MTTETKTTQVGDVFHVLHPFSYADSTSWTAGVTARRGQELTVTQELLEANRDRLGRSVFDLLHDPDHQSEIWGRVLVAPGPFPATLVPTTPGTTEHNDARRAAVHAAHTISDPDERRAALLSVEQRYGPAMPTSRTTAWYGPR